MVWMSIIGISSGKPPIEVERASVSANLPSTTMPMSALVPPISKVISRLRPASSPTQAPPSTPAARPERSVSAGRSATMAGGGDAAVRSHHAEFAGEARFASGRLRDGRCSAGPSGR